MPRPREGDAAKTPDVTALPLVVREIYTIRLAPNMRHRFSKRALGTLASVGLAIILGYAPTRAQENRSVEHGRRRQAALQHSFRDQ